MKVRLTEAGEDVRARERTFLCEVTNNGDQPIQLLGLTPVVNEHLHVQEAAALLTVNQERRVTDLCAGFRQALVDYVAEILPHSGARFKLSHYPRLIGQWLDDVMSNIALMFLFWLFLATWIIHHGLVIVGWRRHLPAMTPTLHELRADRLIPPLRTPDEAVAVGKHWLAKLEPLHATWSDRLQVEALHEACTSRLQALERLASEAHDGAGVTLIESDQTYTRPFVVETERRALRGRQFVISVEVRYTVDVAAPAAGTTLPHLPAPRTSPTASGQRIDSAHATLTVSPNPAIVTLFAVAGALAGLVLHPPTSLHDAAAPSVWVPLVVLAAVFFNVLDFTVFGPYFSRHLDWRGALMVGLLCGLSSVPITEALSRPPGDAKKPDSTATSTTAPPAATISVSAGGSLVVVGPAPASPTPLASTAPAPVSPAAVPMPAAPTAAAPINPPAAAG